VRAYEDALYRVSRNRLLIGVAKMRPCWVEHVGLPSGFNSPEPITVNGLEGREIHAWLGSRCFRASGPTPLAGGFFIRRHWGTASSLLDDGR
jgi:hypothetical protein